LDIRPSQFHYQKIIGEKNDRKKNQTSRKMDRINKNLNYVIYRYLWQTNMNGINREFKSNFKTYVGTIDNCPHIIGFFLTDKTSIVINLGLMPNIILPQAIHI